ncbi:hypothetical protein E2C01_097083 [Portunus trituberculatus]|uniref:Uncharacterized protein n=1 Tax=Portunus trituberculatus TaxID=210409 RepID=A0A5B7K910_PORTR|nr:hypothetical protein [Portunus trituberculatus]
MKRKELNSGSYGKQLKKKNQQRRGRATTGRSEA